MVRSLLLGAESLFRPRTRDLDPGRIRQVLVLEYRLPLGCLVHMTPVYEALKRSGRELEVIVATRGLGLEVLRHSPFVDHLIETPDPLTGLPAAVRTLRAELRARKLSPDCVFTGVADQRTRTALLALLSASGWRGGFTQRPELYHRPIQNDASLSHIRNNLRLAELAGCAFAAEQPRVFFSARDAAAAKAMLREANPEGRPLIVMVTQTSGGQATGWHTERWASVVRQAEALGCAIVYAGAAKDAAGIEGIRGTAGGTGTSIAGRTTIPELAAVLALSDCVVSVDTGTMHVGRAVGTPMVVLGPSWQKPTEWMPLGVANVRILRGADRDAIPEGYRLDEITGDAVLAALNELLGAYPPSEDVRDGRLSSSLSSIDHLASTSQEVRR